MGAGSCIDHGRLTSRYGIWSELFGYVRSIVTSAGPVPVTEMATTGSVVVVVGGAVVVVVVVDGTLVVVVVDVVVVCAAVGLLEPPPVASATVVPAAAAPTMTPIRTINQTGTATVRLVGPSPSISPPTNEPRPRGPTLY
jgi:hypothetical protein